MRTNLENSSILMAFGVAHPRLTDSNEFRQLVESAKITKACCQLPVGALGLPLTLNGAFATAAPTPLQICKETITAGVLRSGVLSA